MISTLRYSVITRFIRPLLWGNCVTTSAHIYWTIFPILEQCDFLEYVLVVGGIMVSEWAVTKIVGYGLMRLSNSRLRFGSVGNLKKSVAVTTNSRLFFRLSVTWFWVKMCLFWPPRLILLHFYSKNFLPSYFYFKMKWLGRRIFKKKFFFGNIFEHMFFVDFFFMILRENSYFFCIFGWFK